MTPIPVHPEGPRYARSLVFVPGLWTPAAVFRPLASFLAHRGWAGLIVDGARGGVAERAAELAELVRAGDSPPVLVGHDAGGLIALATAHLAALAGVAWLAPIGPRPRPLTRALGPWRVAGAVLRGRDLPTPSGAAAVALFDDPAPAGLLPTEDVALVRDVLRAPALRSPSPAPAIALIAGAGDRLAAQASVPGADRLDVEVPGRWLLGATAWRATAGTLHRWLVRRLGVENLDLYEEAMAERDDD